jgi:hypothetical protein
VDQVSQDERVGVLVIRVFVENGPERRLLVRLLEVSQSGDDRVIGIVATSAAAMRLVNKWMDSLEIEAMPARDAP